MYSSKQQCSIAQGNTVQSTTAPVYQQPAAAEHDQLQEKQHQQPVA